MPCRFHRLQLNAAASAVPGEAQDVQGPELDELPGEGQDVPDLEQGEVPGVRPEA